MKLTIGIAFYICLIGLTFCYAQPHNSNNGNFQVSHNKGCAPLTISVTVPTALCDPPNSNCDFFYEADPIQNTFTHTYNTPGTYNLVGVFQGSVTDRITITVLPNTPPEFEIYSCGGNAVQVNVTDTNYNQYVIDYNDGSPVVVVPSGSMAKDTHTFAGSGNKTITVRGRNLNADDNCNPSSKVVTVVPALPVATITQLIVLNESDIQLDFNTQPNILYRLQVARNSSTNFQTLQDVYETTTTTVNNLRTDDNYYCFRLGVLDPCNNTINYSNTICSSNFDVSALNNINRLNWTTSSSGVSNFSFTKNTDPPLSASAASTSLDDTNTTCGVAYCYQQTTNYVNGSRSISLSKCVTAISTNTPTVVENISTIVAEKTIVDLQWTQDPSFVPSLYTVTKFVNGKSATVNTSTTQTYTDDNYLLDVTSCYKINYVDACGNKSPVSVEACPMLLVSTLQSDNAVSLSWSEYMGWKDGVDHYVVEKFNDQGQLLLTVNTNNATTYLDNTQDLNNQIASYRITAIANQAGVSPSVSNTVTIIKEPNLFYPTAFTPNNDGLNDIFNVFGQFITAYEMRIFNRWGELMYTTDDLEKGWDGHFKGTLMPEGTYVFRTTITDQAGRTFDRSGTILLLKKD